MEGDQAAPLDWVVSEKVTFKCTSRSQPREDGEIMELLCHQGPIAPG